MVLTAVYINYVEGGKDGEMFSFLVTINNTINMVFLIYKNYFSLIGLG